MTFQELRDKHNQFIYEGFQVTEEGKDLKVSFNFTISPDIHFRPEIILPNVPLGFDNQKIDNLVFNLGMVELLSYWKATCSPKIIIKAGPPAGGLNEEQINFWKKLLIKGLGEFFYTNKIDFIKEDLVSFVIASEAKQSSSVADPTQIASSQTPRNDMTLEDRDLILVGGGKDSAVTLDSVSKSEKQFNCLMLNPTQAALDIAKAGGCKNPIIVKRIIDPKLLELNIQGYLNGHTPFSAYLAFLATLAGMLYDYKNLVVSNEASSDEINTLWNGQTINHQYSKTTEFEKDFRDYSQKYLAPTNYYSYLRSLSELEISELFSKMPKYHKLFRSCNKGSRMGIWCGKCPKCVSTYLTLYPFLGSKIEEIFGRDLLDDENLIPILKGLLREGDAVKPFECVATVEEIKTAVSLGRERARKDNQEIPKVLQISI